MKKLLSYVMVGALALIAPPVSAQSIDNIGGICCPFSDARLKADIAPIDNSMGRILALKGVHYKWKDGSGEEVGLLAEDVREQFPELVHERDGYLTVDYQKLVAPMIETIRNLNERVKMLEAQARAR
ncbi:hypothetical protein D3C87_1082340 [compost metagenome]